MTDAKRKVSECHASQGGMQMRRGLMGFITKMFGGMEDYMQAYPPVGEVFKRKVDLFDV